jgi:hypothetical protein
MKWIRLGVEKTVWKAEWAWFLDRRERRAKPGIEPLFDSLGQKRRVFETPSLIHNNVFHHGRKDAYPFIY